MRIFHGFDELPCFRNPVVTVGSYDGVHAGHRKLLDTIKDIASREDGESVVITFSPHPREVLSDSGSIKLLTTLAEKIMLLEKAGVNNLIIVPFTKEFSELPSYDFVKKYLIDKVGVSTLVVGYNHHFGHKKSGDFSYLERMSKEFGFGIYMQLRYDVDNDKVSSTIIRKLIKSGSVSKAEYYLGYPYFITVHQDGDMIILGDKNKLMPPDGTYPVEVADGKKSYESELLVHADGHISLSFIKNQPTPIDLMIIFA